MASLIDFEWENAAEWDLEAPVCRLQKSMFQEVNSPRVCYDTSLCSGLSALPAGKGKSKIQQTAFPRRLYTTGPRKAQTFSSKAKIADRLPGERDNEAKTAWRKRVPPTGTYELPSRYDRIDPRLFKRQSGVKTKGSEKSPYLILEQIGSQTGTFIEPPSNLLTRLLKIWGTEDQVQAAKLALQNWVIESQNEARSSNGKIWVKTNSEPSARRRAAIDKKMQEEALKQTYRRTPRNTEILSTVGIFSFPSKEYDVHAILGQNLEAFDQIKVDCCCYIIFKEEMSAFEILSDSVSSLEEAICRIRVAFCEMASRNSKPRRLHLVEPPSPELFRNEVKLEGQDDLPSWVKPVSKFLKFPGVIPVAAGPKPATEKMIMWEGDRQELSSANQQSLKYAIQKALADLRFYRGHIQMRVHFGIPVMLAYKKPAGERHTFDEFAAVLKLSQTRGEVVKCIGNGEMAATLMSRCCQATNLFTPGDAMTQTLEDIQPTISATFEFSISGFSGPIRLELDFSIAEDDYEVTGVRWLKYNTLGGQSTDVFGVMKPRKALEAMTLNLDKGLGWQLEVTTTTRLEASKITSEMRNFVKRVKIEVPQPLLGQRKADAHPKVKFLDIGTLGMQSFIQQSRFQYQLVDSDYIFEVTKYEYSTRVPGERVAGCLCTSNDVIWGASFYHGQWDTTLKRQIDLGVGKVGNWLPDLYTFFPEGRMSPTNSMVHNGFEEFVEKVEVMTGLLTGE